MKIIADNKIPFLKGVLEPFCDVEYFPGKEINSDVVKNADALIIRTRTKCDKNLLEGSSVKFIATATIGFDHIDTQFCESNGIRWTNAPGCNAASVQQWFMASILHFARENKIDLTKRTLGIIGLGNVGTKILRFADNLGLRVLINDPPKVRREGACGYNTIATLQKECDVLTFHVPLNRDGSDKTHHMVDFEFLDKINPGTILINSSRGEVIQDEALLDYLIANKFEGVILDVWEHEPEITKELLSASSIATPHIAGYSTDGKANGTAMSVQALSKYFQWPLNDWYPEELPDAMEPIIEIDARQKSRQHIISEAILHTYPIMQDDSKLRNHVEDFEKLRGDYPIRREPKAYTVVLKNDNRNFKVSLERLGFKVKEEK
jgi:erythronate-4-phosphate dehydrogenase